MKCPRCGNTFESYSLSELFEFQRRLGKAIEGKKFKVDDHYSLCERYHYVHKECGEEYENNLP